MADSMFGESSFLGDLGVTLGLGEAGDKNAEERSRDAWERRVLEMQNAVQWKVGDLRNAGLNPILAANSAAGAGGGGGGGGGGGAVQASNMFSASEANSARGAADRELSGPGGTREAEQKLLSEQANSAAQASNLTRAQTAATWASIPGISAEEALKLSQTALNEQTKLTSGATARQAEASTDKTRKEIELLEQDLKGAVTEGKIDETNYGEVMRTVNRFFRSIIGAHPARR